MIQTIRKATVRVLGRTVMDGGMLWLASPLSEAGFRVSDAHWLEVVLRSDDTVVDPERLDRTPRYAIKVEKDNVYTGVMRQMEETFRVFDSSRPWTTEVRILKLSECTESLMAVKEIRTDGRITPLEERGEKIEFIGDSITCGYGVEGKDELEPFTTATENAEIAYAGLVTDWLGMDRMLTAFSGHGIISGYTADPEKRNLDALVPPFYEYVGRNSYILPSGRCLQDIPWDFRQWQPDRVVIHLGTNDLSWAQEREPRKDMFRKQYKEFLKTVRRRNPKAKLLCVLGIMGTGLNAKMVQAVNEYRMENGDTNIHTLALEDQNGDRDGYGCSFHPSATTQRLLAERILYMIQNT